MGEDWGHLIQQPLSNAIYNHNTIKEIGRYKTISLTDLLKEINGSMIWFRANLKLILLTPNNIEIPTGLSKEKLEEIYEKSDFDWRDIEKLKIFKEWYDCNIYEPYLKKLKSIES